MCYFKIKIILKNKQVYRNTYYIILLNNMSCLGQNYNPQPPREWYRYSNSCIQFPIVNDVRSAYELSMLAKGNILQYKKNSSNITKNQRYSQIAKGMWTNRTTTWATQSDTYTNPNTSNLKRNGYSGSVDGVNTIYDPRICPPPIITPTNNPLPDIGSGGVQSPPIPPPPPEPPGSTPILPPSQSTPIVPVPVIPDGGTLQCNVTENICTGQVTSKTKQSFCYPTSSSDVPGRIIYLCYNDGLPTYYPKTKLTYGTSGDKWPVNAKFILPA